MKKVAIFRNNKNQAIRLPSEFRYEGISELEVTKQGNTIMLRPAKPTWCSFKHEPLADGDFLAADPAVIEGGAP